MPVVGDDPAAIDEDEGTRMIRYAIDHGVNYVDTAYFYHKEQSESFVGRVLQDGYREKVKLATKLPSWLAKSADDFDRFLDLQSERLQTTPDFYLLHALKKEHWDNLRGMGVLDWAERAMAAGRFTHLGFSFHAPVEEFIEIVDGYDNWTLCQIQYNYMDIEHQAGTEGLRHAAAKGLGVVIMEPLRGGQLTKRTPEPVAQLWATAEQPRTPADWALQWVWNQPEVSLVLSGMSAMQHVEENVKSADKSGVGMLSDDELELIARVRDVYRNLSPIPCTDCKYCQPCPSGVKIPNILNVYNESVMYEDPKGAKLAYSWIEEEQRADKCIECMECEEVCPQNIPITDWLKKAHAEFGNGA
jgi:predicted aldo/keto reductase-like oxidoreductase